MTAAVAEVPTRVLFVCLGNICRSPTAEAVFRRKAEQTGWTDLLLADSAGTAAWHIGKAPDARAQDHARERGYDLSTLRARQVGLEDFVTFDHILAMDDDNLDALKRLRDQARMTFGPDAKASLDRLLSYHPDTPRHDVPDPYYGGASGFEQVLDLVESACDGLLRQLLKSRGVFGCVC